jgi:hypothetical protein
MSREERPLGSDSQGPTSVSATATKPAASGIVPRRPVTVSSLEVERRAARDRIKAVNDHLRICRWLEQLAPLTVYYRRPW